MASSRCSATFTFFAPVVASLGLGLGGCAHKPAPPPESATRSSSNTNSGAISARSKDGAGSSSSSSLGCGAIRVHFDLDSSEIKQDDRPLLEQTARCLKDQAGLRVTIEGNADERGTEEYNVALGDRRAQSVARYLEKLGATRDQLKTVSYGKDNPLCTAHDESCWTENRRAQIKPPTK